MYPYCEMQIEYYDIHVVEKKTPRNSTASIASWKPNNSLLLKANNNSYLENTRESIEAMEIFPSAVILRAKKKKKLTQESWDRTQWHHEQADE